MDQVTPRLEYPAVQLAQQVHAGAQRLGGEKPDQIRQRRRNGSGHAGRVSPLPEYACGLAGRQSARVRL